MFGRADWRYKNTRVKRETERMKKEEELADRLAELESVKNGIQKAEFEEATQTGSARALMHLEQRETHLAHNALTLVRREALRRVLEQERQLYNTELSQRGLAIYQQRI